MKTNVSRETILHEAEFCVIGGGMAGLSAAIAAARRGIRTILMQDRPVLGGNASSEIRMWIRGARGENNKETGIVSEVELENIYKNPELNYSVWDSVLLGAAWREKDLTLLMNTACLDAKSENGHITEVTGFQLTTYTFHTVKADVFADCSGDSILAPLVGAKWTKGREAKSEFGEDIEPETADLKTMGNSCLLQARETDHPVKFIKPEWAYTYETEADLPSRGHRPDDPNENLWWIEVGGEGDTIADAEKTRDELLKIVFGVWDHVKNRGDHGADNWEIDWVGFLPGKRESRRYIAAHTLTQGDIENAGRHFDDIVAYGGWTMDDHHPGGFYYFGPPTTHHKAPSPYGIPYRSLYSVNIDNLLFAGRNIGATHAALSSTRVMATCAVMGQAVGNAAALCVKYACKPGDLYPAHVRELQEEILFDGCYLPGLRRHIADATKEAASDLTAAEKAILFSGLERPANPLWYPDDAPVQTISRKSGESITYTFDTPQSGTVRLVLDFDHSRASVSESRILQDYATRCNIPLSRPAIKMPANLAKEITVTAKTPDGREIVLLSDKNNYRHLIWLPLPEPVISVSAHFGAAWQSDETRLYAFDVVPR